MQSFLNEIHGEISSYFQTNLEFRLIVSIIVSISIAFSLYGWLCTMQVIRNNMGFCNDSFTIAICSELMLAIFVIPPMILRCTLNCIYPIVQNSTGSPKPASAYSNHIAVPQPQMPIPNHAYLSYNNLYTIQEKQSSV
jgi:hypothetical protein